MHLSARHTLPATMTQPEEQKRSRVNASGVLRGGNRPRLLPVPNTDVMMVYGCHEVMIQRLQTCQKSHVRQGCVKNKKAQLGWMKYTLGLYKHNRRPKSPLYQRLLYFTHAKAFKASARVREIKGKAWTAGPNPGATI